MYAARPRAPPPAYTEPVPETQTSPNPDGVWLDEGEVNPGWAPPASGAPPTRRPIPAPLIYGAVVLALALLVVTIWGFGGFKRRTDALIDTPVGAPISTGPYEFRFTEVTAQRTKEFDGTISWELTAIGTGSTTGDSSIAPNATGKYGMFVSKDDASGEVEEAASDKIGADDSHQRHAFTPGLAPLPYSVTFKYRETYRPGSTVRFLVFKLQYGDFSLVGDDGEKSWRNTVYAYQFQLPVRVLPDDTY